MSDDEYTDDDSASDAPNDDGLDGKSLYESIGVAKDATPTEIKKAYHRMALKLHPDKNPDNPDAAKQFQTLQKVYGVLGDVDKRKTYDETGASTTPSSPETSSTPSTSTTGECTGR